MDDKKKRPASWRRSITTQYSIGYFLLLLLMVLLFFVSFLSGIILSTRYERTIARLTELNELFVRVEDTNKVVFIYYTYFSQEQRDEYQEKTGEIRTMLDQIREGLRQNYSREVMDLCCLVETYLEESDALVDQIQQKVASGHISMEGAGLGAAYRRTQDVVTYINRSFQTVYTDKLAETERERKSIQGVRRVLTVAQLCAVLVAVAVCFAFYQDIVHGITLSVNELTAFARRVARSPGEPQEHISITTGDELEVLSGAFNEMIDTIHDQMDRLQQDAIMREQLRQTEVENLRVTAALQASQMKLLQSHINPHFLFNTLNMITQTAHMEGAEETAEMMAVTAEMMRYNLGRTTKSVTLRAEIQNTRNYVYIQRCRFGSRIDFRFEIDEGCLDLEVPCLIVQPLVENAITHGVGPLVEGGRVSVRLFPQGELVWLEVADNGQGIAPDRLERLRSELAADGESGHIGLSNVRQRLRLYFGGRLRFQVDSGEGTTVRIGIPCAGARGAAEGEREVDGEHGQVYPADRG